jgi:hypothetical protein
MKGHQDIIVTRSEKLSMMKQLRRDLKDLTLLMNKAESLLPLLSDKELREMMPKDLPKIDEPKAVKVVKKKKMPAKLKNKAVKEKPDEDEKAKLEAALKRIEEQLGNL